MKSNTLLWVVIGGLVLIGGYKLLSRPAVTPAPVASPGTIAGPSSPTPAAITSVLLSEQSDLGQSGTAIFRENAEGNLVVIMTLTGGTFADPQPAHIHLGSCPSPGAIKYALANVVGGKSETVIDTTWAALVAAGEKLAINVHKSSAESKVYTACGDLLLTSAVGTTTGKSTTPGY